MYSWLANDVPEGGRSGWGLAATSTCAVLTVALAFCDANRVLGFCENGCQALVSIGILEGSMPRCAFRLRIKKEAVEEYEREHTRVWPELLAKLKEVGISDYSIFRQDQDLFLCMKVDDFNRAWEVLDRDPINQRWQQAMSRLFEPLPVPAGQRFSMMKEVFFLE
jgi:L-rhamnose mutarotase